MTLRDLPADRSRAGAPAGTAETRERGPVPPLSATTLLEVWERGHRKAPAERAQLLLAAGCPDDPPAVLEGMALGRRDARLLEIRTRTFGERLDAVAVCPACGEPLEMELPVADLAAGGAAGVSAEHPNDPAELLSLDQGGYTVRFRLPTGADLGAVCASPEPEPRALLARCVVEAWRGEEQIEPDGLPEPVAAAVAERMERADPRANAALDLTCPGCGHRWTSPLDIASYFWAEIEAWALRTLREVHDLASAYGWREGDILAMSRWRRQRYLDLIRE